MKNIYVIPAIVAFSFTLSACMVTPDGQVQMGGDIKYAYNCESGGAQPVHVAMPDTVGCNAEQQAAYAKGGVAAVKDMTENKPVITGTSDKIGPAALAEVPGSGAGPASRVEGNYLRTESSSTH